MNFRVIGRFLGFLLLAEGVFMLPAALVALYYGEAHVAQATFFSMALCGALGGGLYFLCKKAAGTVYARESFVLAGIGWVIVSLMGALPFYFSGEMPRFSSAFFESVAGFTTTGTFLQSHIEEWTRGLLFWRNFTQWLGGIGVLAFVLALMRSRGAGSSLQVFRAEAPGPQVGKIMPKTRDSVQSIYTVYIGLSVLMLIFLLLGGMPLYDSFCTMFGVAGTGGFGVYSDSMASYSPYLQGVCTIFMILFGTNFALYHLVLRGGWRQALKDEELRLYGLILLVSISAITLSLGVGGYGGFGQSLHNASFMTASVITSTGLSIADYYHWPGIARSILFVLMIIGAMGGSTAGGFKIARLLILFKSFRAGLHRLLHPRSVTSVRVNGKTLGEDALWRINLFLFVYCATILAAFLLVSLDSQPLENNLTAVIACINNTGPGFGLVGSMAHFGEYSLFSQFILSLCMLLGRLEIFPILLLFFPSTWRMKT